MQKPAERCTGHECGRELPAADTESTSVSATTRFFYDGQGHQVKRLDPDGSYTLYFFGMDEVVLAAAVFRSVRSFYYPGGERCGGMGY